MSANGSGDAHRHLSRRPARGVRRYFLEDLRIYREKNLAKVGMEAFFSNLERDTANWRARS